jgi:hypothetical protein
MATSFEATTESLPTVTRQTRRQVELSSRVSWGRYFHTEVSGADREELGCSSRPEWKRVHGSSDAP